MANKCNIIIHFLLIVIVALAFAEPLLVSHSHWVEYTYVENVFLTRTPEACCKYT